MNKQGNNGIGWCTHTWNPCTGCYNQCSYCYAKKIAERFSVEHSKPLPRAGIDICAPNDNRSDTILFYNRTKDAFPVGFDPTLYFHRLDEPAKLKKPANIFVCSMADLFGDWIPDEWIEAVFDACRKAPQHNYLFLTKNPERYKEIPLDVKVRKNYWFGSTLTNSTDKWYGGNIWYPFTDMENSRVKTFVSYEPILERHVPDSIISDSIFLNAINWLIFGLETPVKKDNPFQWTWIEDLVKEAVKQGIPIYLKPSLRDKVPSEYYLQQLPEGLRRNNVNR